MREAQGGAHAGARMREAQGDAHAGARMREAQGGDTHAGARTRSYGRFLLSSDNDQKGARMWQKVHPPSEAINCEQGNSFLTW